MANKRKTINFIIGQRVRLARDEAEWTQEKLAEKLFTTGANISRKEAGKIPFTVEELYLIAEELQVGLSRLLPPAGGESDEWEHESSVAGFFNGLPPDKQTMAYEMLRALWEVHGRSQTTHGQKAE